jgi:uncharacterized protein
MIRRLIWLLLPVVALATFEPSLGQSNDAKSKLGVEFVKVLHLDKLALGYEEQMNSSLQQAWPELSRCEEGKTLIGNVAHALTTDMVADMASADFAVELGSFVAEEFSEEELRHIIEFYRSPVGQKVLARMPALSERAEKFSKDWAARGKERRHALVQSYSTKFEQAETACNDRDSADHLKSRTTESDRGND